MHLARPIGSRFLRQAVARMASAANSRNSGGASRLATDVVSVGRARSGDRLLPGQQFASGAGGTDRCRRNRNGRNTGGRDGLGEGYRSWRAGANDNVGLRHFGSLHARLCFAAEKDRQVDAVRRLRVSSPAQFLPRRPGKVIEVDGVPVTAVNANAGSETRNHFLHAFLNQDEDRYTAYWTVRPCIGKGACGEALQLFEKIFSAGLYVQKPARAQG
jgi:hypothetical protein